tara:strand:+ start:151 stop:699 length:549 start_codon:yes stop_codon:yes gene_type:complete
MKKSTILMMAATSGWVATGSAATVYNESIGGDLSNDAMSPTVLSSGTDSVFGGLLDDQFVPANADRDDHFVISDLPGGGTAQFDFSATIDNSNLGVQFTFSTLAGGTLYTSPVYMADNSGTTGAIAVPISGEIKISVQNVNSDEGGSPATAWEVSTNDVVPEPSTSALVALGALLALRRSRK